MKDTEELENVVNSLMYKEINLMIKARPSTYNGETRMKYYAIKVIPQRNVKSENQALLKRLDHYKSY